MMVYDLTIWSWPYAQPERRNQRRPISPAGALGLSY